MDDILEVHARKYLIHHSPSTREGLSAFFDHLVEVHNVSVKSVQKGSLILTVECPTLESLERLWNDYQSGCLNDIAESYLVTDELKRKLGLDHVRLRITIEEENYLICKKALMEISGELGSLYRAFLENMYFGLICMSFTTLIIYTKKLLNSDWLRKECSSSVTRVQTCNTSVKLVTRVQITNGF